MKWRVIKTGAELFDLLHAYGLGILLAHACGQPVEVMDTGCSYTLAGHVSAQPCGPFDLVDEALALPTPQEVAAARLLDAGVPVPVAILTVCSQSSLRPLALCVPCQWQISCGRRDAMTPLPSGPSGKRASLLPGGKISSQRSHLTGQKAGSNASCGTTIPSHPPSRFPQTLVQNETSRW